jgi:hypothetical protein
MLHKIWWRSNRQKNEHMIAAFGSDHVLIYNLVSFLYTRFGFGFTYI